MAREIRQLVINQEIKNVPVMGDDILFDIVFNRSLKGSKKTPSCFFWDVKFLS